MADPQQQSTQLEGLQLGGSDLTQLLEKEFKPKTGERKTAVEQAVQTLAAQALGHAKLVSGDVMSTIEAMIAELDRVMSRQISLILHHDHFQRRADPEAGPLPPQLSRPCRQRFGQRSPT